MNRIELICHRQAQRARRESGQLFAGQPFGPGPMAEVAVPVLPWRLRWKDWSVRYLPHLAMAAIILILLALAVFGAMGCGSNHFHVECNPDGTVKSADMSSVASDMSIDAAGICAHQAKAK